MQLMKNTIYINRMQELITDLTGQLKHSNNTILNLNPGVNIFDIHPFFQSLKAPIIESKSAYHTFPCINMTFNNVNFFCDIIFKKESDFMAILLFNYSDHYATVQKKIQKSKDSFLERAYKIHGDTYGYHLQSFSGMTKDIPTKTKNNMK